MTFRPRNCHAVDLFYFVFILFYFSFFELSITSFINRQWISRTLQIILRLMRRFLVVDAVVFLPSFAL